MQKHNNQDGHVDSLYDDILGQERAREAVEAREKQKDLPYPKNWGMVKSKDGRGQADQKPYPKN